MTKYIVQTGETYRKEDHLTLGTVTEKELRSEIVSLLDDEEIIEVSYIGKSTGWIVTIRKENEDERI